MTRRGILVTLLIVGLTTVLAACCPAVEPPPPPNPHSLLCPRDTRRPSAARAAARLVPGVQADHCASPGHRSARRR
jgi:hypothetical protein